MPRLSSAKREKFCQLVAAGMSQEKAYIKAGYESKSPNAHGSRLASDGSVRARIAELQEKAQEKTLITIENLTEKLLALYQQSQELGQVAGGVSAIKEIAVLHGMRIEKNINKNENVNVTPDEAKTELNVIDAELRRLGYTGATAQEAETPAHKVQ